MKSNTPTIPPKYKIGVNKINKPSLNISIKEQAKKKQLRLELMTNTQNKPDLAKIQNSPKYLNNVKSKIVGKSYQVNPLKVKSLCANVNINNPLSLNKNSTKHTKTRSFGSDKSILSSTNANPKRKGSNNSNCENDISFRSNKYSFIVKTPNNNDDSHGDKSLQGLNRTSMNEKTVNPLDLQLFNRLKKTEIQLKNDEASAYKKNTSRSFIGNCFDNPLSFRQLETQSYRELKGYENGYNKFEKPNKKLSNNSSILDSKSSNVRSVKHLDLSVINTQNSKVPKVTTRKRFSNRIPKLSSQNIRTGNCNSESNSTRSYFQNDLTQARVSNYSKLNPKQVILMEKYKNFLFKGTVEDFTSAEFISNPCLSLGDCDEFILGCSYNTHKGRVRKYNEDRIKILFNLEKDIVKTSKQSIRTNMSDDTKKTGASENWPNINYFAIFDGHGGNTVCDWLKDHLHEYIIKQDSFPADPSKALAQAFQEADDFLIGLLTKDAFNKEKHDTSGSCAIVVLTVDDQCYIANLGDSRALLSSCSFKRLYTLTTDHRPEEEEEKRRITSSGGQVYRCPITGISRCIPGGLSVRLLIKLVFSVIR